MRINQVVSSVMNGRVTSLCTPDYSVNLNVIAQAIADQLQGAGGSGVTSDAGSCM